MERRRRLQDQIVLLTGGAGEIGTVVARRYLEEGATVILTGRTEAKLRACVESLIKEGLATADRLTYLIMDGANPTSLKGGFEQIKSKFGRLDVLINNAGTAGPVRPLGEIPITGADLLTKAGVDKETLSESVGSLLGGPWLTTTMFLPLLGAGSRVINVSTIFSRTDYYGRIPYVVPKAGLNTLSKEFATKLGSERGIRVNTVYPGPVQTDRIVKVFKAMDDSKGLAKGTTEEEILGRMIIRDGESRSGGKLLSKDEIADVIVFLGSEESAGLAGHDFEVTHGLQLQDDLELGLVERPNLGQVDYGDRVVWIVGGATPEEVEVFAKKFDLLGANIVITPPTELPASHLEDLTKMGYETVTFDKAPGYFQNAGKKHLSVAILPAHKVDHYGNDIVKMSAQEVQRFLDQEVTGTITVAQEVERVMRVTEHWWKSAPTVVFVPDRPITENPLTRIRVAVIQELVRVWRHEGQVRLDRFTGIPWQIYQLFLPNDTNDHLGEHVAEWAAWLMSGLANFNEINIGIKLSFWPSVNNLLFHEHLKSQNICGLHSQRVALITGGSEGIGGEISRHLLLSGARIMIAERNSEKLQRIAQHLHELCRTHGYNDPESRVLVAPGVDVAFETRMKHVVHESVARFGRLDFVINNAGLAGAEQMVIDMPRALWDRTVTGNFISNYRLLINALPQMKKQGEGHILNMSSYFGGYRHGWIPYTNRADYAVSKAGQIAMAEALAPFVGPDVQVNAIAPGPVHGARLNGSKAALGLYERRAKLVIENKLLNLLHAAGINASRMGVSVDEVVSTIALNDRALLFKFLTSHGLGDDKQKLQAFFSSREKIDGTSRSQFIDSVIFEKLVMRLQSRGVLLRHPIAFNEATEPVVSEVEIRIGARNFREGILKYFARANMPTDIDIATSVVWTLAQKMQTGEVICPTNGFKFSGFELTSSFRADGVNLQIPAAPTMRSLGSLVLVGDSMFKKMAEVIAAARTVSKLAVVVGSAKGRTQLGKHLEALGISDFDITVEETADPARAFDRAIGKVGRADMVLSFPFGDITLPFGDKTEAWHSLPAVEEFSHMTEVNLTNHFLVAQRAAQLGDCHVTFITPDIDAASNALECALIEMFSRTLRVLTLAAGTEARHLAGKAEYCQLDGRLSGQDIYLLIDSIFASQQAEREAPGKVA